MLINNRNKYYVCELFVSANFVIISLSNVFESCYNFVLNLSVFLNFNKCTMEYKRFLKTGTFTDKTLSRWWVIIWYTTEVKRLAIIFYKALEQQYLTGTSKVALLSQLTTLDLHQTNKVTRGHYGILLYVFSCCALFRWILIRRNFSQWM